MMFASTVALLASLSALLTAAIVVGGFLAHARPAIAGESDVKLRRATAVGGLAGLVAAAVALAGLDLAM